MTESISTYREVWRQLLPAGVEVGAGAIVVALPPSAFSSPSSSDLGSDRITEFYSGRVYAREALALFGVHSADLAVGSDRRPIWPAGYIGSITHTRKSSRGFCAAAVARAEEWSAIGIDAEYAGGIAPAAWPAILTQSELTQIKSLPPNEREPEVTRRWCVKEAAVKAAHLPLDPLALETSEYESDCYILSGIMTRLDNCRVRTAFWNKIVCAALAIPR